MKSLWLLFLTFLKIGAISFGGGYAILSMIQQEVVSYGWISGNDFIDIVGISGITPGPIALNASVFIGYKLFGIPGALITMIAVLAIPCILSLSVTVFLERFRHLTWIDGVLYGIKPAVIGLIGVAFFTISKASINGLFDLFIALAVTLLLFRTKISPVLILLGSALLGVLFYAL